MSVQDFLTTNQAHVFSLMKKNIKHGRIAHAYLFEGDKGTGKHELSLWLAQRLFCQQVREEEPCGNCVQCKRIEMEEHPNVRVIQPEGQSIKVDQIRQLQSEFSRKGFEKGMQIFIIQQADTMNVSAANSLLKFLEEPEGEMLAILEVESLGKMLPTIQSRCQIIHFNPLNKQQLVKQLQDNGINEKSANLLASLTNSYHKAVEISEDEWFNGAKDVIEQWFLYLKKKDSQAFIYVQKAIMTIAKEKQQQQDILAILLFYFQNERNQMLQHQVSGVAANREVEIILQGQQKLAANVPFQGVAEQLSLRILFKE
ncbi:DNA polymerase III subunit delta' [Enterococcus aquimarinus]|uniref:DNA polymerase III subunit delta n=1 Tax=Enterococcus aquimarinus TaxID=328396 RepID=A0A9E3ZSN4_9ENTE|nr:DNA polymerase III subunit delta' [Enterococcus aquimarinus]MCC9273680.1 DNA polymerase III subunit delta' [Enterococcus aquimarinus]